MLVMPPLPPPPFKKGSTTNRPSNGLGECPDASNNRTPEPRAAASTALVESVVEDDVPGRKDKDEIDDEDDIA